MDQPPAEVLVVFHTHWDREWYLPFAVYRNRLVALVDSLLWALEKEPGLRFHLDGQMALLDDYLEQRPWRQAELKRAAQQGRISVGPWYTLADEHLVSGESLIRNLEMGLARASSFGSPMLVGYLPDQFGHTAQMPQILRRAGIDTAVLWRGVPASIRAVVFRWEALDGTAVDAVHMRRGYGAGRDLSLERAPLEVRIDAEPAAEVEANPTGPWLLMSGDDHRPVPVGASQALAAATPAHRVRVASLAEYVEGRPDATDSWRGELHSAGQAFVLKGTLSARFPLKLRHAALERRLERYLEPAWVLAGGRWPQKELDYLWRQLILNSAHDTICGCSIDQVHEQATLRLKRAEAVADSLWKRLSEVGSGLSGAAFNPSPFEREGVPALATGRPDRPALEPVAVEALGLVLEDAGDGGDEYTHEPFGEPTRRDLQAEVELDRVRVRSRSRRRLDEPFVRLAIEVANRRPDHRLRVLVPANTTEGAWAGTAFGAVHRAYRAPGTEPGWEFDVPTHPARGWVDAGGTGVLLAGPFEYELLPGAIAVTLLRCVGWLSRPDLTRRPGHAGPGLETPGAQMIGDHRFEIGVLNHEGGWEEAALPRWAEVFAHPLADLPRKLARSGPAILDPSVMLSALVEVQGRVLMRTYTCGTHPLPGSAPPFRIAEVEPELT